LTPFTSLTIRVGDVAEKAHVERIEIRGHAIVGSSSRPQADDVIVGP